MELSEKLMLIQTKLKAPKSQFNAFGKYQYRSCEDILEALKPYLTETKTIVLVTDEIVLIGDRHYVKAMASISDGEGHFISTTAFAREPKEKKGMDEAQITGATSSYARKYALNGLFLIDDNKDADANGHSEKSASLITEQQLSTLRDHLAELNRDEEKLIKFLGIDKLENCLASDYQKALTAATAKKQ